MPEIDLQDGSDHVDVPPDIPERFVVIPYGYSGWEILDTLSGPVRLADGTEYCPKTRLRYDKGKLYRYGGGNLWQAEATCRKLNLAWGREFDALRSKGLLPRTGK